MASMNMSDFTAETRPIVPYTRHSLLPKEDFVAELKPKSYSQSYLGERGGQCSSPDENDLYLEKILSDSHFSREGITRLLRGSVISLIEKVLTGRPIFSIEGSLHISLFSDECPIDVNFFKSFPRYRNTDCIQQQPFDKSLNVKIKGRDNFSTSSRDDRPDSVCSPFYGPCPSPTGSDSSLQMSLGYHSDRDNSISSPPHDCHIDTSHDRHSSSPTDERSLTSPPRDCHIDTSHVNHTSSPTDESPLTSPPRDCHIDTSHVIHTSSPTDESRLTSPTDESPLTSPTHNSSFIREQQDAYSVPPFPTTEADVSIEEKILLPVNDRSSQSPKMSNKDNDYSMEEMEDSHPQILQTFNNYLCVGFHGKAPILTQVASQSETPSEIPRSDSCRGDTEEMEDDDDDVESDHLLVIDENSPEDLSESIVPEDLSESIVPEVLGESSQTSIDDTDSVSHDNHPERKKLTARDRHEHSSLPPLKDDEAVEELPNEINNARPVVYQEHIAVGTQGNISGISGVNSDVVSLTPHPQSSVSKCPEGFKCKQCCKVLPNTATVSTHVQAVHGLHCCTYCCRTFTAKNNLKRHLLRHTGHRPYKCARCPRSFFRRDDLKGHMVRHEHIKPFRCSVCKKAYTDRACVKNHMAKEHRSRVAHVCPPCGESFDDEETFTSHKRSHPELRQFSCSTCSFIGTNKLMTLKHSLIHSHKPFSCKPCNAYFADPFHYTTHVKKHKKSTTFDQYICCFCDVAHTTYDQFVRHEYSHAHCKVHVCKTCKEQFRSKSQLQDHVKNHKKIADDKPQGKIVRAHHEDTRSSWDPKYDKENRLFNPRTNLTAEPDEDLPKCFNKFHTALSLPTTLEESEDDEDYGQLLDLSMKKEPKDFSEELSKNGTFSTSVRSAGQLQNFPRNGAVNADPAGLSQGCGITPQKFASRKSSEAESPEANLCMSLFILRDRAMKSSLPIYRSCGASSPKERRSNEIDPVTSWSSSKPDPPNQSSNAVTLTADSGVPNAPSDRKMSCDQLSNMRDKHIVRFFPYSREKMADFAAKFMAARGTRLAGQREPLKALIPVGEETAAIIIRDQGISKLPSMVLNNNFHAIPDGRSTTGRNESRNLDCETDKDDGEVMSDNTNSERTLRCHVPTVVKSEPSAAQTERSVSPLDCRSHKAQTDDDNTKQRVSQGGSHSCEFCRELFGSFAQLESHCVEAHKRYLCEHCRKSFTARPNRDRHVRYHTGERPYSCDLCDLSFFRGDDLKYHRTTRHPTAQPFVCTRCSASFTWGRDLERHIRHSKCTI